MRTLIAENMEKILLGLTALVAGIFVPIGEILMFTGFVILIDTITGIWAAKKRGEKIHSSKMKRVLSKLILYPLAIILASWSERILPGIPFIKGAALLLVSVEGKSVLENLGDILGYNLLKMAKIYIMEGKKGLINFKTKKK